MIILTKQEALSAIILFIKMYYDETHSRDAKNILNELQNIQNVTRENAAINLDHYLDNARKIILKQVQRNQVDSALGLVSEQEAFEAMILVLEEYYYKTDSDDLGSFLGDLLHGMYGSTSDPAAWEKWQECLKKIKNKNY
jgi:uncharacterized protein (DUF2225 family)